MKEGNLKLNNPPIGQKGKEILDRKRKAVFERFPLLFTLLGAFGLVATFYGFERLIDEVTIFSNNPAILFATGVIVLLFTGTLYQRLGK